LDLKLWIYENCFSKNGSLNNRISLISWWKNKDILHKLYEINNATSFLDTENITQTIYHILNDIKSIPLCKHCGVKENNFKQFKSGYFDYCSLYCSTQSEERNKKIGKNRDMVSIIEKTKKTNLEKYGVELYYQTEEFKRKSAQSKLERYGNCQYNNLEQNKKTCIEKYGIETLFNNSEFQTRIQRIKLEKFPDGIINWGRKSKPEKEIKEFLNQYGNFNTNRKLLDGLEIDAYSEELNLGIEYCGLYWHSEKFKENNYHYKKYINCKEKNVKLIIIFEDEWIHRKNQVIQFLKANLGVFEKRIFARKCEFIQLKEKSYDFFDKYHIQGSPSNIKYSFGLKYNNEIVGMVSFANHHRKKDQLVLNRLAFKDGYQIIGGASKLIKNSLDILKQDIITWSDNRWSTGKIYEKSGFILDENLGPDYSYVLKDNTFRRQSKQASKKRNFNIPKEITEHEYFHNKGIYRIYDCGKIRWKYNYKQQERKIKEIWKLN
jgi:hypothetical protein